MNVAIPKLNKFVAPCFEAAKCIEIFDVRNGIISSSKLIQCSASDAVFRTKLFQLYEIQTLICNGIKNFYLDQLKSAGVQVIPKINDTVENAINLFLRGKLIESSNSEQNTEIEELISHDDLVKWAENLFIQNGYSVFPCSDHESLLIDLIAKIKCPICSRELKVAICCGAQTYRADQEIREFHHLAKTQYDARVYVYKKNPRLQKCCYEYGIEFLSPDISEPAECSIKSSVIPILRIPIEGHEKAFS
jgi:predicted Fe-Mo cluster-binding NifX family protein